MSNGIKLSPKYGLNPTIPVCFWCGEEKNEVALMGHIGNRRKREDFEAPMRAVINYEPCENCRKGMAQGFTVMEATTEPNDRSTVEIQNGVYPTGMFVVVRNEAASEIFGEEIASKKKVFMRPQDFTRFYGE